MTAINQATSLNETLKQFEIIEANLAKLERISDQIVKHIPQGIAFGNNISYENACRSFENILQYLPGIDGWKPTTLPIDLNTIAQSRMDAQDIGEASAIISVEDEIEKPSVELRKYRFLFNQKRKQLIRDAVIKLIESIDSCIRSIEKGLNPKTEPNFSMNGSEWDKLKNYVEQINILLGSGIKRPERWHYLYRHLHFAMLGDFRDIEKFDWPQVKEYLQQNIYGVNEPIPTQIKDLADLVNHKPTGPVSQELRWKKLTAEQFERLIFSLVSREKGYENAKWLTPTNAPDRGRDISVDRVISDPLGGIIRQRVIIQCKHWLKRSIAVDDIAALQQQMKLWEPPRVDVHVIASSGRFTTDAVDLVEKNNQSDRAMRIEMWPDSHLELLLASRPDLIGEFGLR